MGPVFGVPTALVAWRLVSILTREHKHESVEGISQVSWGKYGVVREELPCLAAGFWGLSKGKRPDAIARWFSAERL